MLNDNSGLDSMDEKDKIDPTLNTTDDLQGSGRTVEVQGTTFTEEEIREANKPQRNVILETIGGSGISGTGSVDTNLDDAEMVDPSHGRTEARTGGISADGSKGV